MLGIRLAYRSNANQRRSNPYTVGSDTAVTVKHSTFHTLINESNNKMIHIKKHAAQNRYLLSQVPVFLQSICVGVTWYKSSGKKRFTVICHVFYWNGFPDLEARHLFEFFHRVHKGS